MQFATLFSLTSAIALAGVNAQSTTVPVTGILGNATTVTNPMGPVYTAVLPTIEYFNPLDPRGNVRGSVSITAAPNGIGASVKVSFSNLPTSGGPFLYHIHVSQVNSTANCLSAAGHFDPFKRGDSPPCNPALPQTCQVGDLSGKYGNITSDPFTASYDDPYISIVPGQSAFIGNRSLVVHFANTTRITCANFALAPNGTAGGNTTATPQPPRYTGAATGTAASLLSVIAIAAAALLMQ